MPLTGPSAVSLGHTSFKCGCVKETSHPFMSVKKFRLSQKPATSQLAEVSCAFANKDCRRPLVCGSKAPGLLEVFSFTPTPSPGVCQKTTCISSGIPIHFLALGRNVFCVQSFSDFWFRSDHSIKFPHCPSQPFLASLYPFFGLGFLCIEERGGEDRNIEAP